MTTFVVITLAALAFLAVTLAIVLKDYVKAAFNAPFISFSVEAKGHTRSPRIEPRHDLTDPEKSMTRNS